VGIGWGWIAAALALGLLCILAILLPFLLAML